MSSEQNSRYEQGLAKISEIHGKPGEDVVFSLGDLGKYIIEFAFGDIYSREGLTLRERQMLTIAILTVLGGRDPQLKIHIRSSLKNVGLTPEEVREIIIHTVSYAGFPTAINAMNLLNDVLAEDE
jgi:4-carboxymuconolactone decarboxylase